MNFYELYIQNKVSILEIDNFVEDWHLNKEFEGQKLSDFLGLHEMEYRLFIENPKKFKETLESIKTSHNSKL